MNSIFNLPPDREEPEPSGSERPGPRRRWVRIIGWSIAGLFCFIVAALFTLGALVNFDGVHRAIIDYAQKEADKSLGVNVRLENFVLHWSTLSLDVYGITADGAAPHPNPPLLHVQHVEVGVRIVSIFHAKWYLSSLRIDRPVAWIYVDKRGVSNIPTIKSSGNSGNSTLFNLGIRHALLDGGEVYYNSRPSAMAADLHNLDLRAAYDSPSQTYSGIFAYSNGQLKYGAYRPIPHSFSIDFALSPRALQVRQATLSSGDSHVLLSATVNNYATRPSVQAQYALAIDGAQVARLLQQPTILAGLVRASGSIEYQDQPNRPLLRSIALKGDVSSNRLEANTGQGRAEVTNLAAHYSLANGNAALSDFRASVLGGEVTAQGVMTDLGGSGAHSDFRAALRGVSLARIKQVLGKSAATPGITLAGTLNATAAAAWGKTMDDLVAHADATIDGDVGNAARAAAAMRTTKRNRSAKAANPPEDAQNLSSVPVESQIHASYAKAAGRLQLTDSYIRTAATDLTLNGAIGSHSSLSIRLQANDLRELASVANVFRTPAPGGSVQPLDLSGTASFQGNVQGSVQAPHVTGQLTAMNLQFNGSRWKLIRADVDASPNRATLNNAVLEPATRGRIELSATAGLSKWAFSKQSPVHVELNASQIGLADLTRFATRFAPGQIPVTGTLNTSINVHGDMTNPEGSGKLTLTGVTAYAQPVKSLNVAFSGNGNQAEAALSLELPAGRIQAHVTVQPKQRTYTAQLSSPGIHLGQLQALKERNIKAEGVLELNASGQGSFDNPQLTAAIHLPTLTVAAQTISAVDLRLNLANHVANASLTSMALNAPIRARASVQLTGDYLADASLDTPTVSLQPILALYAPDEASSISGETQIHATLHGPIKNMKKIEAHVSIPVLEMAYQDKVRLAAPSPIQVNYKDGVIDVPSGSIRGTDTDLQFQANVPIGGNAPMSLALHGAIDLGVAQLFDPDVKSSGKINFNIDSHGALAAGANIGGEIDVVDANFTEPSLPVGVRNGNGVLKLTTDRVNISSFEAKVGGGTVSLEGDVAYRPKLQFALGMAAKGVRMLYPQGLRENIDANLRFNGTGANALLGGTVNLANLTLTPGFDLSTFAGQLSGGVAAPPSQGFTQNVALNLVVNSTNSIELVSRELSVSGAANLQVRGTAAQPVILGRVNLTGGDILLNGNRFVLSGGTVMFINPMQTEPVLNLTLTTTIEEYNIDLRFQGPVEQMKSQYSSNPALPQADIIHLLAFGTTTEAAANNPTPANQEAESLVASQVSSQVTSRIARVAGISQLSVSPVLQSGSNTGPEGADITIQQRVTGNLFVTFESNVATTQDQTIQGEYRISPRVSLSATRDPNAGFGFDALIKNSW